MATEDFFRVIGSGNQVGISGYSKLSKKFLFLQNHLTKDKTLLDQLGMYVVTRIKVRTSQGVDVEDNPFKPYSERYKFFRERKGLPHAKVDLFLSGSMMNALTHKSNPLTREVKIFFMPGMDKSGTSNSAKAFYNQQTRNFFGYSEDERAQMYRMTRMYISKLMRKRKT